MPVPPRERELLKDPFGFDLHPALIETFSLLPLVLVYNHKAHRLEGQRLSRGYLSLLVCIFWVMA